MEGGNEEGSERASEGGSERAREGAALTLILWCYKLNLVNVYISYYVL